MNANEPTAIVTSTSSRLPFLAVLICFHLIVALPLAYFLNIWADEASTLHTTQNGLVVALGSALADEKQAPLYFCLLGLWRNINDSIFFARLFSAGCSVLAIKFFYDLSRKLFADKKTIVVSAIFALHPYLIWTSLEIRVYSLVILLSILLLNFYFEGFLHPIGKSTLASPKRYRIFFVVTSIFALYTNYYLGFLLVACFLGLLALRRWHEAKIYFLQMTIVGIVFLPLVWSLVSQLAVNTGGFQTDRSLIEGVRILWGHLLTFILPTEIFPNDTTSFWSVARLWFVRLGILATIVIFIKNRGKGIDRNIICFSVITSVICIFLLFSYFQLGEWYVEIRHASVLFVSLFLLVALIMVECLPDRMMWPIVALYFVFFSYGIFALYPERVKRGDWANVANFIEKNESENQPIVIFEAYHALALPYHYKGINKVLPDKNFFIWNFEDSPVSENAFKDQIAFVISQIPPEAPEIWLVTEDRCHKPVINIACKPLEDFVRSNYSVVLEKDFYWERIRLLKKQ